MKKLSERKKNIIGFSLIFSVIGYVFIRDNYHDNLLNEGKTKKTIALLIEYNDGAVHNPASGVFRFRVNGKTYTFDESGNYTSMKIGDTILIEYSLKDPSVARVVDKCYMQKYKGKCNE